MQGKLVKSTLTLIIALVMLLSVTQVVCADVGPKPSLTIIVKGMDTDKYWLDLLVTDEPNYSWLKISDEGKKPLSKLAEYSDQEGFHPALLVGTRIPLVGRLEGEKLNNGSFKHSFSYMGVPSTFKIAILKEDGTLIVSDIVNRKQFASIMHYDISGLTVTESTAVSAGVVTEGMSWIKFFINFMINLALTLIIELGIAVLFGFNLKKCLKLLMITNVLTQVMLNLLVFFFFNSIGLFGAILGFVIGEIAVLSIESKVYAASLTEKPRALRITYAITANLLSLLGGLLIFSI